MEKKKYNFLGGLKRPLISFLKKKVVLAALKRILGSAVMGGPVAFVITYVLEHLFDEFAKPLIQASFRKVGYYYNVKDGEHKLERIENAKDINDWRDSIRKS